MCISVFALSAFMSLPSGQSTLCGAGPRAMEDDVQHSQQQIYI